MAKRESLSKKIRFEVFKRDSFSCQYCGRKSPNVILEVDHINPVKRGGKNDIMNLITSCFDCNRGKSDRVISDNSIVEKQRVQIEELNLKKQQLEMMLDWRNELDNVEDLAHGKVCDYFNSFFTKYRLSDSARINYFSKSIKEFGVEKVLDAIKLSVEKYKKSDEDFEICLSKSNGILHYNKLPEHRQKISYIKGIYRNKFKEYDNVKIHLALINFYEAGGDLDFAMNELKGDSFRNSWSFVQWLNN